MIYVPAKFAGAAIIEAIDASMELIVCITEGMPMTGQNFVTQSEQIMFWQLVHFKPVQTFWKHLESSSRYLRNPMLHITQGFFSVTSSRLLEKSIVGLHLFVTVKSSVKP